MAVFNGEKYITEQIKSILKQLKDNDEVIISYDESTDNTLKIVLDLAKKDKRIKVFHGPCCGVIKNFENAILNCNNKYIFLSDQDDIWLDNKVETVLREFKKANADVILHDTFVSDENLNIIYDSFFQIRNSKKGILNNIIKNSYMGCCIAFKNDFKKFFLPFPKNIPMHDQWIGLMGEKYGTVRFIKKPLLIYRRHENNFSALIPVFPNDIESKAAIMYKRLISRINLLLAIIKN